MSSVMDAGAIKLALIQMQPVSGDVPRNVMMIVDWLRNAAEAEAQLLVFPECATSGYGFDGFEDAWPHGVMLDGQELAPLRVACERERLYCVVGILERAKDPRRLHNTAVLLGPDGIEGVYRKIHLPGIGVDRFVTAGEEPFRVIEVPGLDLRLGMHICYDGGFPEATRVLALEGADLAVLPTNWARGTEPIAEHLPSCRAMENVIYFAAVNRVGTEGDFTYIGRSSVAEPSGRVLAMASPDGEEMLIVEIEPAQARRKKIVRISGKAEVDRFRDRRPGFYRRLIEPA